MYYAFFAFLGVFFLNNSGCAFSCLTRSMIHVTPPAASSPMELMAPVASGFEGLPVRVPSAFMPDWAFFSLWRMSVPLFRRSRPPAYPTPWVRRLPESPGSPGPG